MSRRRPPVLRASFVTPDELVVDNFAGGGGASSGIVEALGRPVDLAINHDPKAIVMHRANHPETEHYCQDIFEVDPREACAGRPVGLAWFSPDCTHFSKAKGTAPLSGKTRDLAWVVVRWAEAVRPRIILLENVEEFQTWGPLDASGRPDLRKSGSTFRAWLAKLTDLGYEVDFRLLVAADYGTPTTRKRLFLVARCDGRPIVWPEPTHGKGRSEAWRPASEIIDWSLPCRSIFDPSRPKPLKPATLSRIARGVERYVIGAADPFIIPCTHQGEPRAYSIHEPLRTVTGANRGEFALIEPFIVRHGHYSTITGAGLREGCGAGTFRGQPLRSPLATVCATNDKHLVATFVTKHYGGVVGHDMRRPVGTVTAKDHHALTAAHLLKFYGTSTGSDMRSPVPTVTGQGGHIAQVRAFLMRYNKTGIGRRLDLPLPTVTTKDRFGLVVVHGQLYRIVDIGMRMLQPHELFAANGFPDDYNIAPMVNGKPLTKTDQTALAGNAVCRQVARELVRAQVAS